MIAAANARQRRQGRCEEKKGLSGPLSREKPKVARSEGMAEDWR